MEDKGKLFLGGILLFFGFGFLLEQFGFFNFLGTSFGYLIGLLWPLILIYFGLTMIGKGGRTAGLILTGLGLVFLLSNIFKWNMWSVLWPVIIIGFGVSILLKKPENVAGSFKSNIAADDLVDSVFFWGAEKKISSTQFNGGKINCAFGGYKLDLSNATIASNAELKINCAFGGMEIIVPKGVLVESYGTAFLGGWDNKSLPSEDKNLPRLKVTGSVAFGGIEIHN